MALRNFLEHSLIYQDKDVLVINKPAGLLSVPGKGEHLLDSVLTRLQALNPDSLLIHRLDRDTSGILVFARNKAAQSHISKQFQARTTTKIYHALLEGKILHDGQIDVPVRYDETQPPLHIVDTDFNKSALTYYQVLEHLQIENFDVSRVRFKPVTGRSHQLRVHAQYLGHPIVGDTLYATEQGRKLAARLCLHATELSFVHPVTGKQLNFICPAPF